MWHPPFGFIFFALNRIFILERSQTMEKILHFCGSRKSSFIVTLMAMVFSPFALGDYGLNMPKGVSPVSQEIYSLHMTIFWICCAIGFLVFSVMIYALIRHRRSIGHEAADFHESTTVEIVWTIIPFIILIAMAIPATKTLLLMDDTRESDLTIKITGYRWYWHYDYLDNGVSFFSYLTTPEDEIKNVQPKNADYLLQVDEPLVIPTGKKVRFLVTAKDVLHSWWVPKLGVKKDAIPFLINEVWTQADQEGIYPGQCAELCGAKHGYMPIVVDARSPEAFEEWVNERKAAKAAAVEDPNKEWSLDELMVKGEQEYAKVCAMCHQNNGQGLPPTFPSLVGSDIVTKPENLAEHIRQALYGKGAMPGFATQKSNLEIAAIITYQRNAWGNDTGDIIQPKDIEKARTQD